MAHVLTLPNATVQFSGVVNDLGILLQNAQNVVVSGG